MENEKKKPFDKRAYDKDYIRNHYAWINLGFNKDKPEEVELYNFIKSQPQQAPFLKKLIREAMQKSK